MEDGCGVFFEKMQYKFSVYSRFTHSTRSGSGPFLIKSRAIHI